jgi:RNA-directed DNA polymerase
MMHGDGKSDDSIVPKKSSNKGRERSRPAEKMEGRGSTLGNSQNQTRDQTQCWSSLQQAAMRIREFAERQPQEKFTTLWHHVYNPDHLSEAFDGIKPRAAPGVDGMTWDQYSKEREERIADLSDRLKRGAYRAKPTKRVYIPKADGRQRPLGIPSLEDKIVQKATTAVLTPIYEVDFLGFSYGFRPGRGPHDALDALYVGLQTRKVNWVLDADIRGFFDAIDHEWMIKFVEHRIADERVIRHIKKWLNAGIMEGNEYRRQEEGTPQGGIISPLLANIYLHYVFDLWAHHWRSKKASGEVIIVRYADDFVVGFEHAHEARRFLAELKERFARFNLELHPEKTRLIEFGRYAKERRKQKGKGRPETFEFLGFTHICGESRGGKFMVKRKTSGKRLKRKLQAVHQELKRRMHDPIPVVGEWLRQVMTGYFRYFGVPNNIATLSTFRFWIRKHWQRVLGRRSHKAKVSAERMNRLEQRYLPQPKIYHEWPLERFARRTQSRSPVR